MAYIQNRDFLKSHKHSFSRLDIAFLMNRTDSFSYTESVYKKLFYTKTSYYTKSSYCTNNSYYGQILSILNILSILLMNNYVYYTILHILSIMKMYIIQIFCNNKNSYMNGILPKTSVSLIVINEVSKIPLCHKCLERNYFWNIIIPHLDMASGHSIMKCFMIWKTSELCSLYQFYLTCR